MSKRALLDMCPQDRTQVIWHEEDDCTYIETKQDVDPIMRAAREMMELPKDKEMTLVRLIPKEVLNRSFLEGWFNDDKKWREWANGPEGRAFDTWGRGTV